MKGATKRVVSAVVRGHVNADGIVLILYRPRAGGIEHASELDVDQAIALRDNLDEVIELMRAEPFK